LSGPLLNRRCAPGLEIDIRFEFGFGRRPASLVVHLMWNSVSMVVEVEPIRVVLATTGEPHGGDQKNITWEKWP
jgi:hypothetical protein